MRLVLTDRAETDLESIFDYIAQDSPRQASLYVGQLRQKMKRISRSPRIYAGREGLPEELRAAAHRNYIILFRVTDIGVEVVRVVHGARSLADLLED